MIERLCTLERQIPGVEIILGAAARYRRKKVCRSHHGAYPDNSALHTRTVRPYAGFLESFSSFRSVRAMAVRKFEMQPYFREFHGRALFVWGMAHSYFSVGPQRQRTTHMWLPPGGLALLEFYGASFPRPSFELQCASPFMMRVKAQIFGEAARA
jgi:hypothetical protein